eukprot:TRINITY_DN9667_c0_g3_i1.p1 TRINITY_DN9667_c0_g3~~TRINITY_DN9667_c0_g3_i1.p1  ORF type:complete len:129 (+),score=11.62 TRINITY_DN9667_c0_g3_i1:64-450(+)
MTYFFILSPLTRVVIGVIAPPLLVTLCFQLFAPLAAMMCAHVNLHAALLFLLIPTCCGSTICSIIHLTSGDIYSGVSIEIGCLVCEVGFKVSLLEGLTPFEQSVKRIHSGIQLVIASISRICVLSKRL